LKRCWVTKLTSSKSSSAAGKCLNSSMVRGEKRGVSKRVAISRWTNASEKHAESMAMSDETASTFAKMARASTRKNGVGSKCGNRVEESDTNTGR